MLVFVDESGDTGLKLDKGSSPYFIITLVLFEDDEEAHALDIRIDLLRHELNLPNDFEFRFCQNPLKVKQPFFEAISSYGFFYFSIIMNKSELFGPGFRFKNSFYKYTSSLIFENAKPYLNNAIVVFDGSGSRDFKKEFDAYLRKKINATERGCCYIRKVKMQNSKNNNLIQLADMICCAVANTLKSVGKQPDFRQMVRHREVYVQMWPKNKNSKP
jgi:hypothetical protein